MDYDTGMTSTSPPKPTLLKSPSEIERKWHATRKESVLKGSQIERLATVFNVTASNISARLDQAIERTAADTEARQLLLSAKSELELCWETGIYCISQWAESPCD